MINEMRTRLTKQNREATRMCDDSVRVCLCSVSETARRIFVDEKLLQLPHKFRWQLPNSRRLVKATVVINEVMHFDTSNGKR